jgi:GST-like protein
MLKLYVWKTPNGYKVPIFFEELAESGMEMKYELVPVNLQKGEQKTPEYFSLNPNGKIPVLVDEDAEGGSLTLFESGTILEYLAEKSGKFTLAGSSLDLHGIYAVKEWLTFSVAGIGPSFGQFSHYKKYATEHVPYAIERAESEAKRVLGVMNTRLGEVDFLAGEYSVADISAWSWTRAVRNFQTWSGGLRRSKTALQ